MTRLERIVAAPSGSHHPIKLPKKLKESRSEKAQWHVFREL